MDWKIRLSAAFSLRASRTISMPCVLVCLIDEDRRCLNITKNEFLCSAHGVHYL